MLPAHHKTRPHAKTNGVYLCAVISLAVCLFVTFRYWKREVNELLLLNQQLRDELSKKSTELLQGGELLSQRQNKIRNLETDLSKRDSTISDLTASVEKEAAKSSELSKKNEEASKEYNHLEQLKAETDGKLEACQKDSLENSKLKETTIENLTTELSTAKSQMVVLSMELQKQQVAIDEAERVKTATATSAGTVATATEGSAQTVAVNESDQATVQGGVVTTVASQEKPQTKNEGFDGEVAGQTEKAQQVADAYLTSTQEKPATVRKEELENKMMFAQEGVEATIGYKTDDAEISNRRSGSQDDQAETLNDALINEAKEGMIETQSATEVVR